MPYRRGPASGDAGYNKFNFISTSTQEYRKNRVTTSCNITHGNRCGRFAVAPFHIWK